MVDLQMEWKFIMSLIISQLVIMIGNIKKYHYDVNHFSGGLNTCILCDDKFRDFVLLPSARQVFTRNSDA